MKPAHTIFSVPEHIYRVPSALRRQSECRVRIGCIYQPDIKVSPAVEIYKSRKPGITALGLVIGSVILSGLYGLGMYL